MVRRIEGRVVEGEWLAKVGTALDAGSGSSVELESRCSPSPSCFLLTTVQYNTMQCNVLAMHLDY